MRRGNTRAGLPGQQAGGSQGCRPLQGRGPAPQGRRAEAPLPKAARHPTGKNRHLNSARGTADKQGSFCSQPSLVTGPFPRAGSALANSRETLTRATHQCDIYENQVDSCHLSQTLANETRRSQSVQTPQFPLLTFCCPRAPARPPRDMQPLCPLRAPLGCDSLSDLPVFKDLDGLEEEPGVFQDAPQGRPQRGGALLTTSRPGCVPSRDLHGGR